MLHRVTAEKLSYSFSGKSVPVLEVDPGDEVVFETVDARGTRAMKPSDDYVVPPPPPLEKLNPVTGPVAIRGAEVGDTLLAEIKELKIGSKGFSSARQDMGILQDLVKNPGIKLIEIRNGMVLFADGISFPARPMIGTIGVAPASGEMPSVKPGPHGGNLDCNDIVAGSKLYLPVGVRGGLFAVGDVHAAMGDGETSGGGIEIGANVRVKLRIVKGMRIGYPLVETEKNIVVIHNAPDLNQAVRGVVEKSVSLLKKKLGLSFEDAYRLASISGDVVLCQASVTALDAIVRMRLPKLLRLTNSD